MSEAVYMINFYQTEVYHQSRDCFELQGVSDLKELPTDAAEESTHLTPCTACGSSGDSIPVCPECDSSNILKQTHRWASNNSPQFKWEDRYGLAHMDFDAWRCRDCDAEFDDPRERDRKIDSGRRGLAGRLAAADPDEVFDDE